MGREKIEGISNQLREYDRKRGTLETVKCIFCDFCGADKGTDHSHMMPPILMDFITPSLITVTQFPRRHIHVQDFCHSLPLHLHCILHTQYCLSAEAGTFCPLLPYCGHHMWVIPQPQCGDTLTRTTATSWVRSVERVTAATPTQNHSRLQLTSCSVPSVGWRHKRWVTCRSMSSGTCGTLIAYTSAQSFQGRTH